MIFPVPYIPNENYRGSRGFGADRSKVAALLAIPGGKLKHGAVDLVVPPKTPVLAMEDGVVLSGPRKFFSTFTPLRFNIQDSLRAIARSVKWAL